MDFGTAIIGAVMLALCVLFVLFIRNNSQKRKLVLTQALTELATANRATVTRQELSGNTLLGLDENANKLLFVKKGRIGLTSLTVDMRDIRDCKLVKVNKTVPNQGGNYTMLEKLSLQFVPTDSKSADIHLMFYDEAEDQSLSNELEFMEKWVAIIHAQLKKK
jgi:hypothetical protein